MFLIGNKNDLEDSRLVSQEQAMQIKKDFDFDLFMETSAKTGFNAQKLFVEAGKLLFKDYYKYKQTKKNNNPTEKLKKEKVPQKNTPQKKGCC